MKITVEFESEEEFETFKTSGKAPRQPRKKADGTDETAPTTSTSAAPAPLQPPSGASAGPTAFPAAAALGLSPSPFATGPVADPVVAKLVEHINAKIDGALATGQPTDAVLNWFRGQCGAEAANATLDQIKTVFLPKAPLPTLENIAKLMGP